MYKVLDLFSGIGGFSIGLERTGGFKTVAFCEIEKFPQKVLKKHWPDVPIYNDIRSLDGTQFKGSIDVVCGGFPCQPYSKAGKRRGSEDDRALWPEMLRVIQESNPFIVLGENVAGLKSMELDEMLFGLESLGYEVRVFNIPAAGMDAWHERQRIWIIADLNGEGLQKRLVQPRIQEETRRYEYGENSPLGGSRFARPELVRRFHGIPNRVDRLKGLGNAVVPQIPELIGRAIMEAEYG